MMHLGRTPTFTKLGERKVTCVRMRGGKTKQRAIRLDAGNFGWATEAIARKTRILGVVYSAVSNELVRTNTLVKGQIIQIDAAPFRLWYEQHYGQQLGKKKLEGTKPGAPTAAGAPVVAKKEAGKKAAAKKDAAKKAPAKEAAPKKPAAKKEVVGKEAPAKKEGAEKKEGEGKEKKEGEGKEKKEGAKKDKKEGKEKKVKKVKADKKKGKPEPNTTAAAILAARKLIKLSIRKRQNIIDKLKAKERKAKKLAKNPKKPVPKKAPNPNKKPKLTKAGNPKKVKTYSQKRQASARRGRIAPIDPHLAEQFVQGRLYACIASRPGQDGCADGYILEGKELEFYLRKLQKKKTTAK